MHSAGIVSEMNRVDVDHSFPGLGQQQGQGVGHKDCLRRISIVRYSRGPFVEVVQLMQERSGRKRNM